MDIKRGEPYKEKGSKFLGFAAKIESTDDFKEFMKLIKKEHRNAAHYCFAYVVDERPEDDGDSLSDNKVRKEKSSNDREPSGCGNALLGLLKYKNLENCAVIIVRYFGGVLLGASNLIRAYAAAGKRVIECI